MNVDLEKTFNYLSWQFIQDTLSVAHLSINLIVLIMDCISTSFIQVV